MLDPRSRIPLSPLLRRLLGHMQYRAKEHTPLKARQYYPEMRAVSSFAAGLLLRRRPGRDVADALYSKPTVRHGGGVQRCSETPCSLDSDRHRISSCYFGILQQRGAIYFVDWAGVRCKAALASLVEGMRTITSRHTNLDTF